MSEKKKSTLPFGSVSDILKTFGDIGGAAMIAKAIREHTRAMLVNDYYRRNISSLLLNGEERLLANAIIYADNLIARLNNKTTTDDDNPPTNP